MYNVLWILAILFLSTPAMANYVGSETQYFNPTSDNMDFFTVHSSRTLSKGILRTTLFFDYGKNTHHLSNFKNEMLQGQLGLGLGLGNRVSFSVVGLGVLNHHGRVGGAYTKDNFTYLRTSLKYRFCQCYKGGFAVVAGMGFGFIDPEYFIDDDNDFGASVIFVYDRILTDSVKFGVNLGYRYKNSKSIRPGSLVYGDFITSRNGSDVLTSLGLNVLLSKKWVATSEIYMNLPLNEFFDFKAHKNMYDQKGAEVLLGVNYNFTQNMDIGFGGTAGVFSHGQNAPWRVFLAMGYGFKGASKKDTVFSFSKGQWAKKYFKAPVKEVDKKDVLLEKFFNIKADFAQGSANLNDLAKMKLDKKIGTYLRENKEYKMIFVQGYVDSLGEKKLNKALSQGRAQAIKNYLVRVHKVLIDKIKVVSFQEGTLIFNQSNLNKKTKNKRIMIKIK